jgi:ParB-like chromosome segregation protein Spo0J
MNAELKFHPLADIFPLMEGAEFEALVADIKAHGLREPVVVFEDAILDGRNRYRACQSVGIDPEFTIYTGDDPVSYVVSLNMRRRHLDESQRAMVAAKLATLKDGQRADRVEGMPIGRASDLLNVGERSVARARTVLDHGTSELVHAVEDGNVSVSAAAEVAVLPESEQGEVLASGDKAVKAKAKNLRAKRAKKSMRKKPAAIDVSVQEARSREIEARDREMKGLACRLIALDRDVAHVVYKVLGMSMQDRMAFESALEEGLRLSNDTHDGWIESDGLDESAAA